jgi:hypothetical protein
MNIVGADGDIRTKAGDKTLAFFCDQNFFKKKMLTIAQLSYLVASRMSNVEQINLEFLEAKSINLNDTCYLSRRSSVGRAGDS